MEFSPTSIQSIINTCLLLGGIGAMIYFSVKSQTPKIQKDVIDAYESRLKQVEAQLSDFRVENKDLQAKVNQLIGENKKLREDLSLRNPDFEKLIKTLSSTMPLVIERVDKVNADANARYEEIMRVIQDYIANLSTHTITDTVTSTK